MNIFKWILFCIVVISISSCCGLLDGLRQYDSADSNKVYHFNLSINTLAQKVNKASSDYYLQRKGLSEKIAPCKAPQQYHTWTICFNEKENAYKRCGYQEVSVFYKGSAERVDSSYHGCWTELQLIDLITVKETDSLEVNNDFGRMVIAGNKNTSKLYTTSLHVLKTKCRSKKDQQTHVIEQFEENIIQKIRDKY